MKTLVRTLAAALVVSAAVPAIAQQAAPPPVKVSNEASKAISELDAAIKANRAAEIPGKFAAAEAAAKTAEDRYVIAQLRLNAAIARKDDRATATAIEGLLATGKVPAQNVSNLRLNLAKLKYQNKDYAGAVGAAQALIAAEPGNTQAMLLMSDAQRAQGNKAGAAESVRKAIAAQKSAGQAVPASWTKQALALSYESKAPGTDQLALDWIRSDPSPANWRDAIVIYTDATRISDDDMVDVYRLQRAAGALKGEADYYRYSSALALKGFPGEAKAVLDEGFAGGTVSKGSSALSSVYSVASGKVAGDKASLLAGEKSALAAPAARSAMVTANGLLGYGEYSRAAGLYRAALSKSGVDRDLANLRLGIALARANDKAGATAALNAVGGTKAPIARLWLTWLATRS